MSEQYELGHPDVSRRPVLYLDVDDTLLPANEEYMVRVEGRNLFRGAPGAKELFLWARDNCEVRWLTYWAPYGKMSDWQQRRLAILLDVPLAYIEQVSGRQWAFGLPNVTSKCHGVYWEEHDAGRPWLWLEDGLPPNEHEELAERGASHNYWKVDVTEDVNGLVGMIERIQEYFA